MDVLKTFATGLNAGHLVGPMEDVPMLAITDTVPAMVDLPEGALILDLGGRPLAHVAHATTQTSHYAAGDFRVVVITTQGLRQLALIAAVDANPRPVPSGEPVPVSA